METLDLPVIAAGVCGSDTMRTRNGFSPLSVGHELVVRRLGRSYVVCPMKPCGLCHRCGSGQTQHCSNLEALGRSDDRRGGFSGVVSVDETQLRLVPPELTSDVATLADPLACVLAALEGIDPTGLRTLVVGDGGIACIAAVYLQLCGARVDVVAKDRTRAAALSNQLGLACICAADVAHAAYSLVIEAVGGSVAAPVSIAIDAVGNRGDVRMLGVFAPDLSVEMNPRRLFEKEATIRGSKSYRVRLGEDDAPDPLDEAVVVLSDSAEAFTKVITNSFELTDAYQLEAALKRRGVGRSVGTRLGSAVDR